ncbi:MAG: exodeoxyribonuclease VII small subunit, partial [Methylophagaceae bacterium]
MAKRKKLNYEASIAELESLVERLEQGDISLEESLKLYE